MTIRFARFDTPLGPTYATADDDAVTGIYFEGQRHGVPIAADWVEDPEHPPLAACVRQLAEYFAGTRGDFELALRPRGTAFQQRVWAQIARVPLGATITYAELARRAGAHAAVRAAGAATGRNPLSIVVPCHRIVGRDGSLTGYAGGLGKKAWLLEREGARVPAAA